MQEPRRGRKMLPYKTKTQPGCGLRFWVGLLHFPITAFGRTDSFDNAIGSIEKGFIHYKKADIEKDEDKKSPSRIELGTGKTE